MKSIGVVLTMEWILLLFAVTGIISGFSAGLLGLGGGVIIVPSSLLILSSFPEIGFEERQIMPVAVATSLATIPFTGASAVVQHIKSGRLQWQILFRLLPGLFCGALLGAPLANLMGGPLLQGVFGIFLLILAGKMSGLFSKGTRKFIRDETVSVNSLSSKASEISKPEGLVAGFGISLIASLFGIGGGSLTVPYLASKGFLMQSAIAVSSAAGAFLACVGCLSFIWYGWGENSEVSLTLGYVYLPGVLGILSTSLLSAKIGVISAHKISSQKLRFLFSIVLLGVGLKMIQ